MGVPKKNPLDTQPQIEPHLSDKTLEVRKWILKTASKIEEKGYDKAVFILQEWIKNKTQE